MYAMDVVINTVKIQPVDFILERFFDEERSSILKRIKMMIPTNSRADAIVKIIQVYNEISAKVAGSC
jgi:ribosomal protein L13